MKTHMKMLLASLIFTFSSNRTFCQDSIPTGRVIYTYKLGVPANHIPVLIAFEFSKECYRQFEHGSGNSNNALETMIRNKIAANPADSNRYLDWLNVAKKEDSINAEQILYSSLSSNKAYTKWIEPYTKTVFCVVDTLPDMHWEIMADTATISGLFCQKAMGRSIGNSYVAWFTPSVPVSVAPFQMRGLPGLLVKVVNLSNGTVISLSELTWPCKLPKPLSTYNCDSYRQISSTERDEIFRREDAKVRKWTAEMMKAYNEQQNRKDND